jgi:hypothetical protein
VRTFSVKNFERFQHYADRSPPWIKLYNALLDDYAFACLQDASKLHLIMIWLLASRSNNKIPYDSEWISARINATEPIELDTLIEAGFLQLNEALPSMEQDASAALAPCLPRERDRVEREKEKNPPIAPHGGRVGRKAKVNGRDKSCDLAFDKFWEPYPEKVGKPQARKAFPKALAKAGSVEVIISGLCRYIAAKPAERSWLNPATFLNQERWLDQPAPQHGVGNGTGDLLSERRRPTTPPRPEDVRDDGT